MICTFVKDSGEKCDRPYDDDVKKRCKFHNCIYDCEYKYVRGAKKGQTCGKNSQWGVRYCKSHEAQMRKKERSEKKFTSITYTSNVFNEDNVMDPLEYFNDDEVDYHDTGVTLFWPEAKKDFMFGEMEVKKGDKYVVKYEYISHTETSVKCNMKLQRGFYYNKKFEEEMSSVVYVVKDFMPPYLLY